MPLVSPPGHEESASQTKQSSVSDYQSVAPNITTNKSNAPTVTLKTAPTPMDTIDKLPSSQLVPPFGKVLSNLPSCHSSSAVTVDVEAQRMCILVKPYQNKYKCFPIARGPSPKCTWNGTDTIGTHMGAKYETLQPTKSGTQYYDRDGMTMTARNKGDGGKILHKITDCEDDIQLRTRGCIAIPCDKWPLVKAQFNKRITVCGGRDKSDTDEPICNQLDISPVPAWINTDDSTN
jgi:hypothetical protein